MRENAKGGFTFELKTCNLKKELDVAARWGWETSFRTEITTCTNAFGYTSSEHTEGP